MRFCEAPWPHLEIDEFLPPEIAQHIAENWPTQGWSWLKHSDVVRPDGTSLRRYQPLAQHFQAFTAQAISDIEGCLKSFFRPAVPIYPLALLVEDAPGYWIRRHTDCAGKVISAQCYFASPGDDESRGVKLEGDKTKQIPYRFNHGYAFRVTKGSWHRVTRSSGVRKSLQLIYYDTPAPNL